MIAKTVYCLIKHFHLGIALRICWRGFGVADIQELEELCSELIDGLLAAVHVDLFWNSELKNQSL